MTMLPPGNPPSSELGPGSCPAEVGVDPGGIPTAPIKEGYALPEHYFNRELSWIEFNARVLHEALDERTPLLERLKFLAIFESNLDEFFMVRVAVIRRQLETGVLLPTPDGLTPQQQLRQISQHLRPLIQKLHECFRQELVPKLAEQGIHIRNFSDLTEAERQELREYFDRRLFPLLTPLAVDPGHPFPYISNLSLNLAVVVRDPENGQGAFCPRQSAQHPAPLRAPAGWGELCAAGAGDCPPPGGAVCGHGGAGVPSLPHHPRR
jgi:hypothetical protein